MKFAMLITITQGDCFENTTGCRSMGLEFAAFFNTRFGQHQRCCRHCPHKQQRIF